LETLVNEYVNECVDADEYDNEYPMPTVAEFVALFARGYFDGEYEIDQLCEVNDITKRQYNAAVKAHKLARALVKPIPVATLQAKLDAWVLDGYAPSVGGRTITKVSGYVGTIGWVSKGIAYVAADDMAVA
jgi:hypothetical protein